MLKNIFFIMTLIFVGICHSQQITWSKPFTLSQTGLFAAEPEIMVNENGTIIAVWSINNGTNFVIQASRSTDGGRTWTNPQDLSETIAGEDARNPRLAINDNDAAIVIWEKRVGANIRVQRSYSTNGGVSWSSPPVEISPPGDADSTKLVFNNNGNAVAVWRLLSGGIYETEVSRSPDNGNNWSTTTLSPIGITTENPDVCLNNSDEAIAIWEQTVGLDVLIRERHSANAGVSWTPVTDISPAGDDYTQGKIALNENSVGIVVWKIMSAGIQTVQMRNTLDAGVSWKPVQDLSVSQVGLYTPFITINNSNHAVAFWTRNISGNPIPETSYTKDSGGNWSTPRILSPNDSINDHPEITMNNNDIVVPLYAQKINAQLITQTSASFDGGVNWTIPQYISQPGADENFHDVTANDSNVILGIWDRDGIIQVSYATIINLSSSQFSQRSVFQNQLVNGITWQPSAGSILYRVYSDPSLTDLLYEGTDLYYYDGAKKGQSKTYYFVLVDSNGNESIAEVVTIP